MLHSMFLLQGSWFVPAISRLVWLDDGREDDGHRPLGLSIRRFPPTLHRLCHCRTRLLYDAGRPTPRLRELATGVKRDALCWCGECLAGNAEKAGTSTSRDTDGAPGFAPCKTAPVKNPCTAESPAPSSGAPHRSSPGDPSTSGSRPSDFPR